MPSPEARPARTSGTHPAAPAEETLKPEAHQPLVVTVRVEPHYPSMAKLNRIEGPVEVAMKVDRHGVPMDVRVVSGNSALQAAAVQAAEQWRFKPLREPADFRIRFDFKLS
jgi:TonB family protein